ncbi:MAG: glutamate--tRNA ligase [candidate division WOR-3 bacterium]
MSSEKVRVRIAPSPTGAMHLGLARTALYNWLFARQHQGTFILRIDDTDVLRNKEEMLEPILSGLEWLGLDWDEGPKKEGPFAPYYQSQRSAVYEEAVKKLIDCGAAYLDYATPEEIALERERAKQEGKTFRYSRRWLAETEEDCRRFEREGRKPVVRLKMPREGKLIIDDLIRGRVEFDLSLEQDHIIQRQDKTFLYHLTSAVDDGEMKISHIIRAEEHLSNTPRQVFILEALGYPLPKFAHLPYVAEPGTKNKLSKRKLKEYLKKPEFAELMQRAERIRARLHIETTPELFNPVVIDFYQKTGFLPEALLNYLALLGWSFDDRTEFFTRDELIKAFSLERVVRSPAGFDPQKLLAFQVHYMMGLPVEKRVELVLPYLLQANLLSLPVRENERKMVQEIVLAAGDRIKLAGDILEYDYFFVEDEKLTYDEKALRRWLGKRHQRQMLTDAKEALRLLPVWEKEQLQAKLEAYIKEKNIKGMELSQALRVAITGRDYGFGIYDILTIMGKERVINRVERVLSQQHPED